MQCTDTFSYEIGVPDVLTGSSGLIEIELSFLYLQKIECFVFKLKFNTKLFCGGYPNLHFSTT